MHEVDKNINAVIGDAGSNLRSVLDYVAVALVKPFGGNPEKTGFPSPITLRALSVRSDLSDVSAPAPAPSKI
jgi:hypothetical protein